MLRYFFYLAVFGVSFIFFLFFTFPEESLKVRVQSEIQGALVGVVGSDTRVKFADFSMGFLRGFRFKDFECLRNSAQGLQSLLKLNRFQLNPSWLSLLRGVQDFDVSLQLAKGELDASWYDDKTQTKFEVELDALKLEDLKFIQLLWELPLTGQLDGSFGIDQDKKNSNKNSGNIELKLKDWVLDTYTLKNPILMSAKLPKMILSSSKGSQIVGKLKGSQFDISQFDLQGGDVELKLKGYITLSSSGNSNSMLQLSGKLKPKPEWLQTLYQQFASINPALSQMIDPLKDAEGALPIEISGPLSAPLVKVASLTLNK